jgi:hypothetical protein
MNLSGKPDAGNLLVRFDEGDHGSPWSLLYRLWSNRINLATLVG